MKALRWLLLACIIQACPAAVVLAQATNPSTYKRLYVGFNLCRFSYCEYNGNDNHYGAAVKYDFPIGTLVKNRPLFLRAAVSGGWKYLSLGADLKLSFKDACFLAVGLAHDQFFNTDTRDVAYIRNKVSQNLSYSFSFGIETRNMWCELQFRQQLDGTGEVYHFYSKDGTVTDQKYAGQPGSALSVSYGVRFNL